MKIAKLAEYLQKLESTSKRLEITSIIADLLAKVEVEETDTAVYLILGNIDAPYKSLKFNIAEKMMIRILENAYGIKKEEVERLYSKSGDLGDTALELAQEVKEKLKVTQFSLLELHKKLVEIATIEGSGSQDSKIAKTSELLAKLEPLSVKYVVRIILGTTRLGFTELTVIAALSEFINAQDKNALTEHIEAVYSTHPDIGLVAKKIKELGIKGLDTIEIEPGVPILSQKCQRLTDPEEILEKMPTAWAEFKFDGTRVQLHMNRKTKPQSKGDTQTDLFGENKSKYLAKTFTRNQEETTYQYPDLLEAADKQIQADSAIVDGEAIGYDKKTGAFLPFQEIMQRKRKHGIAEMAKDIPLKYFVFDLLYLNGKTLVNKTLRERRALLESVIKPDDTIIVDSHIETTDPEELNDYFEDAKEKGLEGVIIKNPESPYQAGARSFSWIKWKKMDTSLLEDTIDCVILGYWTGKGMRAEFGLGKFLAGIYDKNTDTYKSLTKVGTGLKEDDLTYLKKELDKIKTQKQPSNVSVGKKFIPDVWVQPKIVVELGGDEISASKDHSSEYALRFPRLLKLRTDKKPLETTGLDEIKALFKLQKRGHYD